MSRYAAYALGFPRVGAKRELKRALEKFWQGKLAREALLATGAALRARHWQQQVAAGLDRLPVGDFSFYDHVLDTSVRFGMIPARAREHAAHPLDVYFRMARGRSTGEPPTAAGGMTKWFDTNYHYVVPEIETALEGKRIDVHDDASPQMAEARAFGRPLDVVLLGPVTYLHLAQGHERNLDALPALLSRYRSLLSQLPLAAGDLVRLEEPAASLTLDDHWQRALRYAVSELATALPDRILLSASFGDNVDLLEEMLSVPIAGVHVDLVTAPEQWERVSTWTTGKTLALGVIDGRRPWRTDLRRTLQQLRRVRATGPVQVTTSCSLLHTPYDVALETGLDPEIAQWLAFAMQKLDELRVLRTALERGDDAVAADLDAADRALASRARSERAYVPAVRDRVAAGAVVDGYRSPLAERARVQQARLSLPPLPTTTIGSFPQTPEIREARAALRAGKCTRAAYDAAMRRAIDRALEAQESAGLDVLVHGEPERNDMVEYFGAELAGMATTDNGWVQSYGSRCVKPPLIYGDVYRTRPITRDWIAYAQSRTDKPVKGMLTGPVTIMKWSFVRDDLDPVTVTEQIAWALHDEVADLDRHGVAIIQIDEPAFREAMPLRVERRSAYVAWATRAFRIAASAATDATQIHTHMCYSELDDVLDAIERLDADVLTVEATRSGLVLLETLARSGYRHAIGPGVYDVHSPEVPREVDIERRIAALLATVPARRLWVNPDCGLKTRRYEEVLPSLVSMVAAARRARATMPI